MSKKTLKFVLPPIVTGMFVIGQLANIPFLITLPVITWWVFLTIGIVASGALLYQKIKADEIIVELDQSRKGLVFSQSEREEAKKMRRQLKQTRDEMKVTWFHYFVPIVNITLLAFFGYSVLPSVYVLTTILALCVVKTFENTVKKFDDIMSEVQNQPENN